MQRDVLLVPHDPAVVRLGRNVEESAGSKLPHSPVLERYSRRSLDDEAVSCELSVATIPLSPLEGRNYSILTQSALSNAVGPTASVL